MSFSTIPLDVLYDVFVPFLKPSEFLSLALSYKTSNTILR